MKATAVLAAGAASMARAEPVKFDALVAQKEALRLGFTDGSKHFFLLVHREDKSEGQGPLAGVTVNEYGADDIVPGVGGGPRGYLEFPKSTETKLISNGRSRRSLSPVPTASRSYWTKQPISAAAIRRRLSTSVMLPLISMSIVNSMRAL
jgi:hypothetical protein